MPMTGTDSRISFGLEFYDNEEEAAKRAREVAARGDTYNGGYFHGESCGRESRFDYTDDKGVKHFAVSVR